MWNCSIFSILQHRNARALVWTSSPSFSPTFYFNYFLDLSRCCHLLKPSQFCAEGEITASPTHLSQPAKDLQGQLSCQHLHAALPSFWKLPVSLSCFSQWISMQESLFPHLHYCLEVLHLLGSSPSKGCGSKVGKGSAQPCRQHWGFLCKAEPSKPPPFGKKNKIK